MKQQVMWTLAALAIAIPGISGAEDAADAAKEVLTKAAAVKGLTADLEIKTHDPKEKDMAVKSALTVQRGKGWKLESGPPDEHTVVNDLKVQYDYYPKEKKVAKLTADIPEIAESFRKPMDELNPLQVLDSKSLKLVGTETFENEQVYHFEGTTTTQFMPKGAPVAQKMEAWIAKSDGLPRKTIEHVEEGTLTTIYHNVKVNPDIAADTFAFTVPAGVEVMDVNEQMKSGGPGEGKPSQKQPAKASGAKKKAK